MTPSTDLTFSLIMKNGMITIFAIKVPCKMAVYCEGNKIVMSALCFSTMSIVQGSSDLDLILWISDQDEVCNLDTVRSWSTI